MALLQGDVRFRVGLVSGLIALMGVACQGAPEAARDASVEVAETPAEPSSSITADSENAVPPADTTPDTTAETTADTADAASDGALEPAAERVCSASAFVIDTDPAGLNVRSGPGGDFAVIDTLPTNDPVEVTIVSSANGWLKLSLAYSMEQQELEQPGWVYAPLLGVTTTNDDPSSPDSPVPLYASPDGAASVSAEVPKFAEVSLLSCSSNWLEVQSEEASGWLAVGDQCSSPVTTCP